MSTVTYLQNKVNNDKTALSIALSDNNALAVVWYEKEISASELKLKELLNT